MAHAPVVLQSYVALQQVIAGYGTFDARTREAIALVVGNVDGYEYCQSAHTLSAKAAGLSSEQTVAIREDRVDFDPQLAALLTLVRQAAANTGNVADATWQAALDAGWSDTELTGTSAHLALNLFTINRPSGRCQVAAVGESLFASRSRWRVRLVMTRAWRATSVFQPRSSASWRSAVTSASCDRRAGTNSTPVVKLSHCSQTLA